MLTSSCTTPSRPSSTHDLFRSKSSPGDFLIRNLPTEKLGMFSRLDEILILIIHASQCVSPELRSHTTRSGSTENMAKRSKSQKEERDGSHYWYSHLVLSSPIRNMCLATLLATKIRYASIYPSRISAGMYESWSKVTLEHMSLVVYGYSWLPDMYVYLCRLLSRLTQSQHDSRWRDARLSKQQICDSFVLEKVI